MKLTEADLFPNTILTAYILLERNNVAFPYPQVLNYSELLLNYLYLQSNFQVFNSYSGLL